MDRRGSGASRRSCLLSVAAALGVAGCAEGENYDDGGVDGVGDSTPTPEGLYVDGAGIPMGGGQVTMRVTVVNGAGSERSGTVVGYVNVTGAQGSRKTVDVEGKHVARERVTVPGGEREESSLEFDFRMPSGQYSYTKGAHVETGTPTARSPDSTA